MEDLESPATKMWVTEEQTLTESYFNSAPIRSTIRARLAEIADYEKTGVPFHEGGRYFYTLNTGRQNQSVLFAQQTLSEQASIALDPNSMSQNGALAVVGYVVSRDGRYLTYGVSNANSDWLEWHIRDLITGKDLQDLLRNTKYYAPVFTADSKGLYYSAFPTPKPGTELTSQDLNNAVFYHALGTQPSEDREIFEQSSHPLWQYEPQISDDGRWLIVSIGDGEVGDTARESIYVLDLSKPGSGPIPLIDGFDAGYNYIGSDGSLLYFLTTLDAPRGRVIAINPLQAERANWKSVVAEGPDAIDFFDPTSRFAAPGVTLVDHKLIVRTMHDAHSRVMVYGLDGSLLTEVKLPGPGVARGFAGHANDHETFYSFSDLVSPPTLYRFDLVSGLSSVFRAPKVSFNPAAFEERLVFYPAKDGTKIPMLIAYRKGMTLNGNNPVLLYGYGGFDVSVPESFSPVIDSWLELGGIYVIAHIRGGGEYGEDWHRQAILTHKQVSFDDFISGAEWLIKEGYTSKDKLSIVGGSSGGLLVGACITQRPDLFKAAIALVGVMDMLRFDKFGQGAGWIGEVGSPHDPEQFKALYAYSPVHNVRAGTVYPATLLITADHDTRVMPMHSFKFGAELQAAQAGQAPVLVYIQPNSGHLGGTTLSRQLDDTAIMYTFLFENLGMDSQ
jgi:prolyl oligopeptidase